MIPRAHLFPLLCGVLLAPACGDEDGGGELGAPCVQNEDCADGLECDIHDERGSCQKPHDH